MFENYLSKKSAPPMHFNVTDLHCLDRKNGQNFFLASTPILSFWGSKWLKCLDWVLIWGSIGWMGI